MANGLGPLEMRILGLLDPEVERSVHDVRAELQAQGHAVAYTTVMTVLGRLHDKGLAVRDKHGPRYVYRTAARAPSFKDRLLRRVQRSLFSDRLAPFAALLEEDLDKDELRELRRLVDAKLRERR